MKIGKLEVVWGIAWIALGLVIAAVVLAVLGVFEIALVLVIAALVVAVLRS